MSTNIEEFEPISPATSNISAINRTTNLQVEEPNVLWTIYVS